MREYTDECYEDDGGQVVPVVGEDISDEVYDRSSHDDEEDKHGNHFEEEVSKSV